MTRQTMVQLTEELVDVLDREAERREISRSALIREILSEHLADRTEALIDEQIVDGYRRIPAAIPDEWGDLAGSTGAATRDLLRRLDAEERREGHAGW